MADIFQPVRGTLAAIARLPIREGYIYYAYDSGRIYLDKNGNRYMMGGEGGSGSGVIYANGDDTTIVNIIDINEQPTSYYTMSFDALEDSSVTPKVDGLILNEDGRFFRVISVDLDARTMQVLLLAVSGTGGGGGGGGGSVIADLSLSVDSSTIDRGMTFINGQDYYISVTGTSTIDSSVSLYFKFEGLNDYYLTKTVTAQSGVPYLLNINFLPVNDNIKMTVEVGSDNTVMTNLPTRVVSNLRVVTMGIEKSAQFNTAGVFTGPVTVAYYLIGDPTVDETLHVYIDSVEEATYPNIHVTSGERTVVVPTQEPGTHTIGLSVSTVINDNIVYSDRISYELAWTDNISTTPIIWTAEYDPVVVQYENFSVQYLVYDPTTSLNNDYFTVYIYKEGILLSEISRKYTAGQWLTLDLTESYDVGLNNYTIACGAASKNIIFEVTTKGSRDLSLVLPEALIFNLSATGRSNDEISMNRPVWTSNRYSTTFNNFNWYSNGWQNDNDGNGSYLAITNGANIVIPFLNYNTNPATIYTFNDGITDYTIELRFRIRNVQEYSTLVTMIPYYYIYENGIKSEHGVSINEIKQRQANNEDVVIVTDDDGNWVMDEELSAKNKIIKDSEGICFKILGNNPKYGLCIGTLEAYFRSPEGVSSVRYKEDEIINFSVVVSTKEKLASIYLNGILSGSLKLGMDSSFNIGNQIIVNSDYCDIDIYKIRFYSYGLTMPDVIHNYISDIHDLTLYDQNQLTKDNGPTLLSYKKLVEYNNKMLEEGNIDALSMPYAVIEIIDNNSSLKDPNKGQHVPNDDLLPWKKGNNRYCKITFVNPTLDALYNKGEISKEDYETHSPSYVCIGADINVQGTSSQGYPRRNYKTKHKSATGKKDAEKNVHDDWGWFYTNEKFLQDGGNKGKAAFKKWKQDNPNYGTNKYTWKIDYMESSGSYNTGFANLVGNNIYNQHPLQYYNIEGIKMNGLRTSVYGFPVLVFHKHSKPGDVNKIGGPLEDEIYEYIGRYNINQDKGSDELYGFALEVELPYVIDPWDEEVENDEGVVETIHHEHPYISEVAECWEMTDNQGTWTSFSYPTSAQESHFSTYTIDSYDSNNQLIENPRLEVIRHYECRYHKDADFIEAIASDEKPYDLAGVLEKINDPDVGADEKAIWESINTIPKMNRFIINKWSNFERFVNWMDSTDTNKADPTRDIEPVTYEVATPPADMTGATLEIIDDVKYVTFTKDTATYRLLKFKSEFDKHLNLEYCLIYFIMTELLLCYDSRGKNMMLASYGPTEVGGEYIWFPIFYDIDTQLGLNNIGATLWDYDCDATLEKAFSTPSSVLWVNFLAAFEDNIKNKYAQLRSDSKLTYETIDGAYLCNPEVFDSYAMRGIRPIIAIGLDEYYKYVAPSKTGYYNTEGELKYDNNSYAYAINGDRKLSRELLLRNRLNYIDSYWVAGSYTPAVIAQGGVRMRTNANNQATSDKYLDSALLNTLPANAWTGEELALYPKQYYDATPQFEITPFLSQYVFTYNDKLASGAPVKYLGNPVLTLCSDSVTDGYRRTPGFPEQIVIVPAEDFISSLGDLSTKYLSQFTMLNGKRILDLDIGSDAPNYFNNLLGAGIGQFNINDSKYITAEGGTVKLNESRKTLLKRINLTNVTNLAEVLDVSGSEKLRECRALGSLIQYALFAEGAPLDTIHLPKTVSRIDLTEARELTHILTTKPVVFLQPRENYTGLYIEGITDLDENTDPNEVLLNRINIIGGALGYDSYTLLVNALELRDRGNVDGLRLRINLEGVLWSPYVAVEPGSPLLLDVTYYQVTDHSNFVEYSGNDPDVWERAVLNSLIFTYEANPKSNIIQSLALLDKFINDYERAKISPSATSYYTNLQGNLGCPNITGSMFVENANGQAISEAELTDKYAKYFPNLKIYALNVEEAKVTKYVRVLSTGIIETYDVLRSDSIYPKAPKLTLPIPAYQGRDFIGWSTDIEGNNILLPYTIDVNTGNGYYVKQLTKGVREDGTTFTETDEEFIARKTLMINDYLATKYTFTNENTVLTLYAQFLIHQNVIVIYNGNERVGAAIVNNNSTFRNPTKIYKYVNDLIDTSLEFNYIPYKDDSQLELTQTYKFVGYSMNSSDTTTITEAPPQIIVKDITIYSIFEEASVYDNVLDEEWLNCQSNGVMSFSKSGLEGKVTLPKTCNGYTVTSFESRYALPNMTHVFWEQGNSVTKYNDGAFSVNNSDASFASLVYVEVPNYDFTIGANAFLYCRNLFYNDMITLDIVDSVFNKITNYYGQSFSNTVVRNRAGDFLNNKTLKISGYTTNIGTRAFLNDHIMKLLFGDYDRGFRYAYNLGNIYTDLWFQGAGIKSTSLGTTVDRLPQSIDFYYEGSQFYPDSDWENSFLYLLFGNISSNSNWTYPTINYIDIGG